jgi:biopolymer transport protein ExbD
MLDTPLEFKRTNKRTVDISLVPMIDVAMFLLIFFMLAGTMERFEVLDVSPPQAANSKLLDEGHLLILVGKNQEVVLGDEYVDLKTLAERLKPELGGNPNKVITIKADANLSATTMIKVMDAVKAAGGRNISLVTQKVEQP